MLDLERSGRNRKMCLKINRKAWITYWILEMGTGRAVYKMMPRFLALQVGLMVLSVIEMTVFKYTVEKQEQ